MFRPSMLQVYFCVFALCTVCSLTRAAEIEIIDDNGRAVLLKEPARRVVTLSPHVTELVFAAGGGKKIVATVTSSDFPPAALSLPRIGDGMQPDPEKIAAYRPDLIIGWLPDQANLLDVLNIAVYISSPQSLAEIADNVENFGVMLGTSEIARSRADSLRQTLESLGNSVAQGRSAAPVRVFIQAGPEPEYALGGDHILSDVISLCGGVNVFADAASIAPKISAEGVLAVRPDLVLVGRSAVGATPVVDPAALAYWTGVGLPAAQAGRVYMMDADMLYRPGPRLIDAASRICDVIAQARH